MVFLQNFTPVAFAAQAKKTGVIRLGAGQISHSGHPRQRHADAAGISFIHSLIASSMLCISHYPRFLTEQAGKQGYKGHADKGNAAARHKLFHSL